MELREDLYEAAKIAAIRTRGGLRGVIEAALEEYLRGKNAYPVPRKRKG